MRETLDRHHPASVPAQVRLNEGKCLRRGPRTGFGLLTGLLLMLVLVACGGGGSAPTAEPRVIPTMPAARFAQPTTMIGTGTAAATPQTETTDVDEEETNDGEVDEEQLDDDAAGTDDEISSESAVAATPVPAAPDVDLARGANVYQVRGCGECHGAQGEGVPGEGSALAGLTMSESQFTTILRTGGSGRLGSSHLYGPSAISPGGMTALHAWLQSLDD